MSESTTSRQSVSGVLIPCYLVWVLHLLVLLCADCRVWGINHLQFLPPIFTYAYIFIGLVSPLILLPRMETIISNGLEKVSGLFETWRVVRWLVISLVAVVLFAVFRAPVTLLGDGYAVVNNIGNELPVVFKWTETGAVHIVYWVSLLLPVEGLARGEIGYAITSIASGGISIFLFGAIAFTLTNDALSRLISFCLLLCSGWILLFFGYTENYPMLWPFMLLFILAAIQYLQMRRSLVWPVALFILAMVIHLQTLFFAPALLVLFFGRGRGLVFYKNHTRTIWFGIGILIAALIAAFVWKYTTSLAFMVNFLPLLEGRPSGPGYTIFSFSHILDIANLSLLLIPVWPALLYLAWRNRNALRSDIVAIFLMVLSASGFVFLFIVDPRLGLGRDWDLFAMAMLGPALVLLRLAFISDIKRGLSGILIIIAAISTVPYIVANVVKEPSISYFRTLCELDPVRSRSGLVTLRNYYFDNRDSASGDAIELILKDRFPQARLGYIVDNLLDHKQFDYAGVLADSIYRINPYVVDGFNMKGTVFLKSGYLDSAEYYYKQSAELAPYEYRTHVHLSAIYSRKGDKDEMWKHLWRAFELNPTKLTVIHPIAMEFYLGQKYDSAIVYSNRMLSLDSTFADGYLIKGLSQVFKRSFTEARVNLETYRQFDSTSERSGLALRALQKMKELKTAEGQK
ncbi:MAG: hypothetical protein R3F48_04015 [Candidatus Zixiibacteriota bacterium]